MPDADCKAVLGGAYIDDGCMRQWAKTTPATWIRALDAGNLRPQSIRWQIHGRARRTFMAETPNSSWDGSSRSYFCSSTLKPIKTFRQPADGYSVDSNELPEQLTGSLFWVCRGGRHRPVASGVADDGLCEADHSQARPKEFTGTPWRRRLPSSRTSAARQAALPGLVRIPLSLILIMDAEADSGQVALFSNAGVRAGGAGAA
ncbi:hypothetical protein J2805_004140 [Arthrobacter oryzae]|nr:hypothetical protein [Arthrobacter oryzae]